MHNKYEKKMNYFNKKKKIFYKYQLLLFLHIYLCPNLNQNLNNIIINRNRDNGIHLLDTSELFDSSFIYIAQGTIGDYI